MSQGTAPRSRPFHRRRARVLLAALALPALTLAGCADTTNAAAPALATATGPAVNSAAQTSAICAKVESAWTRFVPNGSYSVGTKRYASGHVVQVYKIDYSAYGHVSSDLYGSLTGNREFQLAHDVDVLAAAAGDVHDDPGQSLSPQADLATMKKAAAVVAAECGITLSVPA